MAIVELYRQARMDNLKIYYGDFEEYNSSEIVISDGIFTTTYGGSFSFSSYGDVYGTLQSIRTERLGATSYEVTNIGRGAHQFVNLLNSGDALGAVEYVLAGRDKMLGSAGNDYLMAFDGSNSVFGNKGDDAIFGGRGDDRLDGSVGDDKLSGERGADVLFGGRGADQFVYRDKGESTLTVRDTIKDFGTGRDLINLKPMDANTKAFGNQQFDLVGDDRFSGSPGELRVSEKANATFVLGDTNGDGLADFSFRLAGATSVDERDFIL